MLRPDIILGTRIANPAQAMMQGAQTAGMIDTTRQGIQQNRMLQEFGPGIMAGSPEALNALARFDPGAALSIKSKIAAERRAEAAAARAAAASRRVAAAAAQDRAKAAELAQEVDLLRRVALSRENGDEAFIQALNTSGLAQEGVTPANFDMYLATGEGAIAELGKAVQSSRPEPYEPDWKFVPGSDGQVADMSSTTVPQARMIENFTAPESATQSKINMMATNFQKEGMEPAVALQRATGIVLGSLEPLETGGVLNMGSGQVEGSQLIDPALIPQPGTGPGLYSRADDATGFGPAAARLSSDVLGQAPLVGGLFNFPDQTRAGQAYTQATGELIRALSINPRFPVAEMNRIKEEIQIQPSVFKSPEAMRNRMKELDSYLANRMSFEGTVANSAGVPMEDRLNAQRAFQDLQRFREILSVPKGGTAVDPALEDRLKAYE